MPQFLEIKRHGRLLRIVMNRPEKRNALSAALCRELVAALEEGDADPRVGAMLLSANGKSFCAGMDLSEVNVLAAGEISTPQEQLFTMGSRISKPLVAAVRGAALGGGMGLIINCHIVLAHPEAVFGLTEIRVGLWPFLIFRAVVAGLGERRAVELSLTGRTFGAEEGRDMGLVHEVTPDVEEKAVETALALSRSSAAAIRSGLAFQGQTRGMDWKSAGELARQMRNELTSGADFREGQRAFLEKRTPRWPSIVREDH
jgi:enoyl-CoA hydratase/carnithine racemase